LAAFAPVGQTGYVFIVQSNESDALGYEKRFAQRLAASATWVVAPALLLVLTAAAYQRSRNQRRAHLGAPSTARPAAKETTRPTATTAETIEI
jgi:hypothetical protein